MQDAAVLMMLLVVLQDPGPWSEAVLVSSCCMAAHSMALCSTQCGLLMDEVDVSGASTTSLFVGAD